jgi:AcrR family transcriptional regulator
MHECGNHPKMSSMTINTKRKSRDNDNKHQRLIQAARKVLRDRHFEDVTIPEIAQEAGVAVGTFYLYFKSKTQLLQGIALQFSADTENAVRSVVERKEALETLLESILDEVERVTTEYADVLHLLDFEAAYYTRRPDGHDPLALLRSTLEQQRLEGKLPADLDPDVTADLMDALTGRMVRGRLRTKDKAQASRYRSKVLKLMKVLLSD